MTIGVETTLSCPIKSNHEERGKVVTPPCATHGRLTARQAIGGAAIRGRKKQRPFCNEADRGFNIIPHVKTGIFDSGEMTCRRPAGVSLRDNLENLLRWESK